MTRTIFYTECCIYQVVSDKTPLRYIGGTGLCPKKRLQCHKTAWRQHKLGRTTNVSVNEILDIDPDATIEILHRLTNCTGDALNAMEEWYIKNLTNVVNYYKTGKPLPHPRAKHVKQEKHTASAKHEKNDQQEKCADSGININLANSNKTSINHIPLSL